MKTLAEDTERKSEEVLIDLWRRASPARKLALVVDADRTARALAMTGLRQRFPDEGESVLRRRLADLGLDLIWPGRCTGLSFLMNPPQGELLATIDISLFLRESLWRRVAVD